VFISYRQSDGSELATKAARVLRASGIPVWRDRDDLPPGDTQERLREAFAGGISGAILIVTPEIIKSEVVRDIELPQLLELHRSSDFALQIVNNVADAAGRPDYDAPDSLLVRSPGELKRVDQQAATSEGLSVVAQSLAELRVRRHRDAGYGSGSMLLSLQTRNVGRAMDVSGATLDLRFEGGDDRLPTRVALEDLQVVSRNLPTLVTVSGANGVEIEGGAHLSVAFAIGAAVPATRVPVLRVRPDASTDWWGPVSQASAGIVASGLNVKREQGGDVASHRIVVFVDLIENPDSDRAFEAFWAQRGGEFASRLVVKRTERSWLTPAEGTLFAKAVMDAIRKEWGDQGNDDVHLFLRVPFPMAVLLGHLSNTLECVVYEWGTTEYSAAICVKSGSGAGAVREVFLSD
jgi:hypothetical protein